MSARFVPGDAVVIDARPEPRHHRVPSYVKGRSAVVERVCRPQPEPEKVATADPDGTTVPVYRIRVRQTDLWDDYGGPADDTLEIEMHEHWLRSA